MSEKELQIDIYLMITGTKEALESRRALLNWFREHNCRVQELPAESKAIITFPVGTTRKDGGALPHRKMFLLTLPDGAQVLEFDKMDYWPYSDLAPLNRSHPRQS
jgi:hypothetical protein